MVIHDFIGSCKMLLRDGVIEHTMIDGVLTKCTNYEDDIVEVIKSMEDYTMIIVKKDNHKPVVCIDKEGYISKVDSEWKQLAVQLEMV